MKRVIDIGVYNFVLNIKRKNFIFSSAIFLLALGIYIYRNIGNAGISNDISAFSIYIFNYFIMFISCYIIVADSRNGMHRIIYTSSLTKLQVMGYKYVTSVITAIWFWGLITILQVMLLFIQPSGDTIDVVINDIVTNLGIILFSTLHIASFIMLISSIKKKYITTLMITFLTYALLTYCYQVYLFIMQKNVRLLELMPMIIVNRLVGTQSLAVENVIMLLVYTIVFTLIAYALQKKLDVD